MGSYGCLTQGNWHKYVLEICLLHSSGTTWPGGEGEVWSQLTPPTCLKQAGKKQKPEWLLAEVGLANLGIECSAFLYASHKGQYPYFDELFAWPASLLQILHNQWNRAQSVCLASSLLVHAHNLKLCSKLRSTTSSPLNLTGWLLTWKNGLIEEKYLQLRWWELQKESFFVGAF